PRRVLQALRLVLVEHMDEVLREALVLAEPESFLGEVPASMEYRGGRLYTPDQADAPEPSEAPEQPATSPAEQLPQ
ncbi:MAG: hypothetical protein JXB32_24640, partial [Deltaproteobacteria bacterium]|nr:hypothetical protein [Deltaproteobacteria bacterium]